MRQHQRFLCFFLAIACLLGSGYARALSYTMPNDERLLAQAHGVALVEVEAISAAPGQEETRYAIRVIRQLHGREPARGATLVLPGYETAGGGLVYHGIPILKAGQRVLLFYAPRANGDLQATQLTLGMFFPVSTPQGDIYLRHLDDAKNLSVAKNTRYEQARDAKAFERWIGLRSAGSSAREDYLLAPDAAAPKFNLIRINFNNPNFPIGNGRWRQFEQGTTMQWFAGAGGQQTMQRDEFAQLAAGLAGWVDDPGSLVLMSYAGTGSSAAPENANVTWNDPQNVIPGDYDCSPGGGGILGAGGSSVTSQQHTYNGESWYGLLRGTLLTQPSAGCFFDDDLGRSGIEFFVHEVGHTLGFAHSCGNDVPTSCGSDAAANNATMRGSLHADGRGATLAPDDIAAVRFVYEDLNAPTPTADLSISIEASTSPVPPGETLRYSVVVQNAGPDQATSLQMVQALPPGVAFNNATGTGWDCNTSGATLTCTRATLNSGASSALSVSVNLPLGYAGPPSLASQATIDSNVDDPSTGDNSDGVTVAVDLIVNRLFGNSFE